jgi:NAD-binding of NADP-dependent 3-hydroxyisobutyrate dehydrogenase
LFDRISPVPEVISAKRFSRGEAGQARYLKLVVKTLVGATSSILAEALALGRKGNLSLDAMLDVICQSVAASPLIGYKRDMLVNGNYEPAFTVEQMIKDFDLIMDTARNDHVPMLLSVIVRQQIRAIVRQRERAEGLLRPLRSGGRTGGRSQAMIPPISGQSLRKACNLLKKRRELSYGPAQDPVTERIVLSRSPASASSIPPAFAIHSRLKVEPDQRAGSPRSTIR